MLRKRILFERRRGRWSAGCGWWPGKPWLAFCRVYYGGWHRVLHVGPFWIERTA